MSTKVKCVRQQTGATSNTVSPPLTRALALALALARKYADLETLKGSTNEESKDIEDETLLEIPLTDAEAKEALLHARKAARKLYSKQLRAQSHLVRRSNSRT